MPTVSLTKPTVLKIFRIQEKPVYRSFFKISVKRQIFRVLIGNRTSKYSLDKHMSC